MVRDIKFMRELPVTVIGKDPTGVEGAVVRVILVLQLGEVHEPEDGAVGEPVEQYGTGVHEPGENDAVAPDGRPDAEKDTSWAGPEMELTVICGKTVPPCPTTQLPVLVNQAPGCDST